MSRGSRTRPPRARRVRGLTVATAVFAAAVVSTGAAIAAGSGTFGTEKVGHANVQGTLLPTNQRITPLGKRTVINNGRLLSSALSPDGKHLAALSWNDFTGFLTIFDGKLGSVVQQIGTGIGTDPVLGDGTVAADGPFYSADGKSLWLSQTSDLLRFSVNPDGTVAPKPVTIPLLDAKGPYLPSGIVESPDHNSLYVALNGANTVGVIDVATNTLTKQIPVGVGPRQLVLVHGRLFVSNEGGRPARPGDTTNLTDNTPVVSDASTGAVNNGTLSVVDPVAGLQTSTIKVGLEPTALKASGNTIFVANSNGDSISVVDALSRTVKQTLNVAPLPGSTVGSNPNAIELTPNGTLLVSIGRDNALAVYQYNGETAPAQYEGLIPTDFYPVNVQYNRASGQLVVTNDKGIGSRGPSSTIKAGPDANVVSGHNTYDDTGSITRFAPPTQASLAALTHQVFLNNDWDKLLAHPLAASNTAPVAIPVKLGDPSKIKHVFLLVKENRTYDQVFGDIGKGASDNSLVQYGASITPNEHAIANKYGLFDNFYDEGTLSADGHNWLVQADANDYIEKEFGAFYRSYPAQGGDALAYQRDGFLWNAAEKAGKTAKAYGEYANFFTADVNGPSWMDWYQDSQILEGKAAGPLPVPVDKYKTYSDIPSLNDILDPQYPRFDTDVPDQYRADIWQQDFAKNLRAGTVANLNLLWVPDDHTAGTSGTDPYPTAMVADNDLAVGRILDTISHSSIWKDSAVFVVEDDTQNGADHIDGHRGPLLIASPYAKTGVVNDTYYSQINVVKTIEQILGIAPMNQEDRAAEPMTDAFTNKPNMSMYTALPNQIPLTYGLNAAPSSALEVPKAMLAAPSVPAAVKHIAAQWASWSSHQGFGGGNAQEDAAVPALLNRLDWYTSNGWTKPYPGDRRILGPYEVPGWDRPAQDVG